ncbi:MAG: LysR substrate-binding domain-containing protein [Parahaliea sp.]
MASGLGVSIVPALCREQMREQGVQCLPLVEPAISRRVGIFTRRRHPLSGPAQVLHRLLCEHYDIGAARADD